MYIHLYTYIYIYECVYIYISKRVMYLHNRHENASRYRLSLAKTHWGKGGNVPTFRISTAAASRSRNIYTYMLYMCRISFCFQ